MIGTAFAFSLIAGIAAAIFARRLPAKGWAALALCALPPVGFYYLLGSC